MNFYRSISAGLGVGSIAAIIAILISLPLKSPDDILFNAASVGFAAVGFGGLAGLSWHWSQRDLAVGRQYLASSIGMIVAALAVAAAAGLQFEDALVFTVPLALISSIIPIVGTPIAAKSEKFRNCNYLLLVAIAVAMSIALAGQGDQESGSLSLPPP
ncbi:MAG TPA: hypothetical protein EYQ61_11690 [Dehalococcoidia bacterium]|jgi:hypothetical protein|nr:hypothetical protein [Dehalococcoidia bacterium]HIK89165.1 hypothetical protein [Dehalococcoidia bacterium]